MSVEFSTDLLRALERDVVEAAQRLLGAELVMGELRARIVETEAYRDDEPGCHAFRGKTPRNATMFERPGLAYVYFTYGCHWMLNVVAHPPGRGCAVLLRAAQPLSGLEALHARRPKATRPEDLLSGPGKLAAAFGLGREHDGLDLFDPGSVLQIRAGDAVKNIATGPRIGLAKGKGDEIPWRFIDKDAMRWASKPWIRE